MESLSQWWATLTALNQWFYTAAVFFGVFFLFQLIMGLIGLGGDHGDLGSHPDAALAHHTPEDPQATVVAFKLLSTRSVIAFLTLFTWGAALYLSHGSSLARALLYAVVWGLVAMFLVAAVFYLMRKMTQSGNFSISSCVGSQGTVYLDIPAAGEGEVRVLCSGVMTHFKARHAAGTPLAAGTPVRVVKVLGPNEIEVERDASSSK